MTISSILSITALHTVELTIAVITRSIQLLMWGLIIYLVMLVSSVFIANNLRMTTVYCGTYITDSNHSWLEISNSHNQRILTITADCNTHSIVDVR